MTDHRTYDGRTTSWQKKPKQQKSKRRTEGEVKLEGKMAEFVDWIEGISVLELSKLVKALEERLGVSAAAPVAVAAAAPAARRRRPRPKSRPSSRWF